MLLNAINGLPTYVTKDRLFHLREQRLLQRELLRFPTKAHHLRCFHRKSCTACTVDRAARRCVGSPSASTVGSARWSAWARTNGGDGCAP